MEYEKLIDQFLSNPLGCRGEAGGNRRMFAEGPVLYSYGYHYPAAVRTADGGALVNGDRSTHTTERQKRLITARAADLKVKSAIVPFSALAAAGIGEDFSRGRGPWPGEIKQARAEGFMEYPEPTAEDPDYARYEHILGASLIYFPGTADNEEAAGVYLSAFDEAEPIRLFPYFLCKIPGSPSTINKALKALKPAEITRVEKKGAKVFRQGEWFFVEDLKANPEGEVYKPIRVEYQSWVAGQTEKVTRTRLAVPENYPLENHLATELRRSNNNGQSEILYARGSVRHIPGNGRVPQHKMLKLGDGKTWFRVVKNQALGSWSASGRAD
jgi:hypothetical protein